MRGLFSRFRIVREFFRFLWDEKLYWLIPIAVILLLLGLLAVFGHATGLSPFIYPFI